MANYPLIWKILGLNLMCSPYSSETSNGDEVVSIYALTSPSGFAKCEATRFFQGRHTWQRGPNEYCKEQRMRFNLEAFTRFEPLRGRVEELAARLCDLAEQHATVKWESVSHIISDEQKT